MLSLMNRLLFKSGGPVRGEIADMDERKPVLSTGCQWRAIPKDLPPRSTLRLFRPDPRRHAGRKLAHAADVQDWDGGALVMPALLKLYGLIVILAQLIGAYPPAFNNPW
jgi:hypothetical protein